MRNIIQYSLTLISFSVMVSATVAAESANSSKGQPSASPRSASATTPLQRDPFWPVGFSPVPEKVKEIEQKQQEIKQRTKWPKLVLKGLFKSPDGSYTAYLQKFGEVEKGDIISAKQDGLIYRWRIDSISDKGISTTRLKVEAKNTSLQNR